MSENDNSQSAASFETTDAATSADELLMNAQHVMEKITQLAESAKASALASTESQRLAATALSDVQKKVADITTVATQAVAASTQIADEQAVIATKSDHIQKAQEHADKVRGDLDRALTAATQQATEAEGQNTRAQSAADTAAELLTNIRTTKGSAETDAAAITSALETATESAAQTKALADKAATVEERITAYEKRLAELEAQCAAQLQTITGLLPGATSAGLAHAFNERRKSFLNPSKRWQWLFVGSVCAIVLLTAQGLWHVYQTGTALTYDELLRLWLSRLPVAGALVWLAMYASRESALAKRLEEDYGYKSAIASTFQGFHKQMSEIGTATASNLPLAKLCEDTLTTIASPPGRIYDKHQLTVSPTADLTDAAKTMGNVVKNGASSAVNH